MNMKPQYTLKELKKMYKIRYKKLNLNEIPCVFLNQKKPEYHSIKGILSPFV